MLMLHLAKKSLSNLSGKKKTANSLMELRYEKERTEGQTPMISKESVDVS